MHRGVFIFIVLGIVISLDYYVFQGVKFLSRNLSSPTQSIIKYGYWGLTIFIFLGSIAMFAGLIDRSSTFWRTVIFGTVFVSLFPKVVFALFLLTDDIVRAGRWLVAAFQSSNQVGEGASEISKISRSEFLVKSGMAVATVPLLTTSWGIISGAHDYRVRERTIVLKNLPKQFDGMRVAQISDIHSGSFFNKTAVKGGVELLNAQKPDIVFFTGDLVNDVAVEVKDYVNVFDKIKAPLGVHSVLGNHDYGDYVQWKSKAVWEANMRDLYHAHGAMGWQFMLNENKVITVDGESIGLIGIENWGVGFSQHGDLPKAYKGMEELPTKILLSHDPSHWDAQVRPEFGDIDLMLAGHTHGMQLGIQLGDFEWSPSSWRYKQWGGHYQEGNQQLYVNRGYGYIGMPARIGMPPEITILELKSA